MATLLVVDDEPNILTTLRRALELEGYGVEVAGSGRIALEKLRARAFDLVLLDVMMPEMDGLADAQSAARAQPRAAGHHDVGQRHDRHRGARRPSSAPATSSRSR